MRYQTCQKSRRLSFTDWMYDKRQHEPKSRGGILLKRIKHRLAKNFEVHGKYRGVSYFYNVHGEIDVQNYIYSTKTEGVKF